jgi:tetratricopeptide (TPR) repeat protein
MHPPLKDDVGPTKTQPLLLMGWTELGSINARSAEDLVPDRTAHRISLDYFVNLKALRFELFTAAPKVIINIDSLGTAMAKGDTLLLKVTNFKDPRRWRWELTDNAGKFIQDHEVSLDSHNPNYAAFLDLHGYLDAHSSPDKWVENQTRLIKEVGEWIGREALGHIGERIAEYSTPTTVRVIVPPEASGLLYRPWEIALIGNKPLVFHNVSLVFELEGIKSSVTTLPIEERLRMLAVFSLPTDVSALSLRRERYELMKLINRLVQTHGFAIELRVLQYGMTRDNLQEALEEGEGWDLIHFSGHGEEATLILEKPDGTHDQITSEELSDLLILVSGRLKLVTLSACLSAAATVEETLSWLKLREPEQAWSALSCTKSEVAHMPALALELMNKLDCTALAMRYPVGDEFAINLATELYRLLLEKGQTLTRALQLSMQKALKDGYNAATPPLSLATPTIFGHQAVDLTIKPPSISRSEFILPSTGLAYFPKEPERFVGRTGPLGRTSSALAPGSIKRGVLFHGMAGAGKTACALELAYHQKRSPRFQGFVWYEAPKDGNDIESALSNLALDMEKQLPGFKMAHLVDRSEDFQSWMPRLSEFLELNSILIVLDNLETLLTSDGEWRDKRWEGIVNALLNHEGLSRVVLTSQKPPKNLEKDGRLLVVPVNALSLNEAALLAREMPNIGKLMMGKSYLGLDKGRDLVKRTLSLIQGHPKLIELADSQARDPKALERCLECAADAWGENGSKLDRFFQEGESAQEAEAFLNVLTRWTQEVCRSLSAASRMLFQFLCALEDVDRLDWIVKQVWPILWNDLNLDEEAPELEPNLNALKASGLIDFLVLGKQVRYIAHPGVVQAGMEEVDETFRAKVDSGLTSFWITVYFQMLSGESEEKDEWIISAGLRSATYLIRQKKWSGAAAFLEPVIQRDNSPRTMAAVLPMLRHIDEATKGTDLELANSGVLATALILAGRWQDAENIIRPLIPKFAAQGDFRSASTAATNLLRILHETGRFNEALEQVIELKEYTRKAGLGPWTQLSNEAQGLQVLNSLGRYDVVLEAVKGLREQMRSLPEKGNHEEASEPWNVKEVILDDGREAAMRSSKYELALELNAELADFAKARGATSLELVKIIFNDYLPLLRLRLYKDAGNLLWACKDIFAKERDIKGLSCVFGALADLLYNQSQVDQAIRFEEIALRYSYLYGDPSDISISHNNLAFYLRNFGSKSALDHGLAAIIIRYQMNSGMIASSFNELAMDFAKFGLDALPNSFDQLCDQVEQIEGVHFKKLFERLPSRARDGDKALRAVIEIMRKESAS